MIPALQGCVLAKRQRGKLWHLARLHWTDFSSGVEWYEAICKAGMKGKPRWFYHSRPRPVGYGTCLTATIPEGDRICPACLGKLEEQE